MIVNRVTPGFAASLPREVMVALDLLPGDTIGYVIEDGAVRLIRVQDEDGEDLTPEEITGLTTAQIDALIQEALDDPRPSVSAEEAFADVYAMLDQKRRDAARD